MSIYSYLCCADCKRFIWLGVAVGRSADGSVERFHIGPADAPPITENKPLVAALLRFLAEHHGHSIQTLFDYQFDTVSDRDSYREIGGDCEGDIPFEEYLHEG